MKITFKNKIVQWIIKIVFTALFVYIVNKNITPKDWNILLSYISWLPTLIALFLSLWGLFFQVKRWEIILRYQNFSVNNHIALKTILWGNFLAFVTPGRIGELFRALTLSENRKGDSLFAVIMDKLFIIFTVLIWGLFSIVSLKWFLQISIIKEVKIFILLALFICLITLFILSTKKVFNRKHVISRYFDNIFQNLPRLFSNAGKKALLYSFLAHLCLIGQSVTLLYMFGCTPILKTGTAVGLSYGVMPFLSFFTIGNMGVREGSFHFFLSYIGGDCVPKTPSIESICLGTSIMILLMNIILPACIGLIWYIFDDPKSK